MYINEVCKRTKLTKKAIEYYIEQNLVKPSILENGYRCFNEEDVKQLQTIYFYKNVGLSISEIKQVIQDPNILSDLLYQKNLAVTKQQKQNHLLQKLVDGASIESMYSDITSLLQTQTIIEALLTIFPGYFGMFIAMHFQPYLEIKIEEDTQREALSVIVEWLDSCPDFNVNETQKAYFETFNKHYNSDTIKTIQKQTQEHIQHIDEFMEHYKDTIHMYQTYKESKEYKTSSAYELEQLLKRFCEQSGYYDIFIPAMRRLSPLYEEYYQTLLKANEIFIEKYPNIE